MSEIFLEERVTRLIELSERLQHALTEEREALAGSDPEVLARTTEAKADLCAKIDAVVETLGPEPLSARVEALDAREARTLRPLHAALVELVIANRESNAINGKILHRSQQSVRELINLLGGDGAQPLYAPSGQSTSSPRGGAIAQA